MLKKEFPTNNACLQYLFDIKKRPQCLCGGVFHKLIHRPQFQCSRCRKQISPMVETIFQKSRTSLTMWFHALFIFSNAKSGISAKEMERQLGVTYKCAYRILMQIRNVVNPKRTPLQGIVEYDESWFGGHEKLKHGKEFGGSNTANKIPFMAAVERRGAVHAKVTPDITAKSVANFLDRHVNPAGTLLMTDGSSRYKNASYGYEHHSVNHKKGEYARGRIHTNTVESFFGHIKRSIRGTYKTVSKKHFQSYLDGFIFHYNHRKNDRERFRALLRLIVRVKI